MIVRLHKITWFIFHKIVNMTFFIARKLKLYLSADFRDY